MIRPDSPRPRPLHLHSIILPVIVIIVMVLQIQTASASSVLGASSLFSTSAAPSVLSWRSTSLTTAAGAVRTSAICFLPSLLRQTNDRHRFWMPRHRHSTRSYYDGCGVTRSTTRGRTGLLSAVAGNTSRNTTNIVYPSNNNSFMDHMLYRINEMNVIPSDVQSSLIDFVVDGRILGRVTPQIAQLLTNSHSDSDDGQNLGIFELSSSSYNIGKDDQLLPTSATPATTTILTLGYAAGTTFDQRTQSVSSVMTNLHKMGYISGWRNELYPVSDTFDDSKQPMFLIERAAAPILGLLEYGVHINGFVTNNNNNHQHNNNLHTNEDIQMWMARRSKTKSKYPGYVDHIVAGGQPYGLSLMENVIKECMEEAGIPEDIARRGIQSAGAIGYETYSPIAAAGDSGDQERRGWGVIHRVVLFCFDLYLPQDFVPQAVDGEVDSFFVWGMDDIVKSMDPACDDPIKPNCYPGKIATYYLLTLYL